VREYPNKYIEALEGKKRTLENPSSVLNFSINQPSTNFAIAL